MCDRCYWTVQERPERCKILADTERSFHDLHLWSRPAVNIRLDNAAEYIGTLRTKLEPLGIRLATVPPILELRLSHGDVHPQSYPQFEDRWSFPSESPVWSRV